MGKYISKYTGDEIDKKLNMVGQSSDLLTESKDSLPNAINELQSDLVNLENKFEIIDLGTLFPTYSNYNMCKNGNKYYIIDNLWLNIFDSRFKLLSKISMKTNTNKGNNMAGATMIPIGSNIYIVKNKTATESEIVYVDLDGKNEQILLTVQHTNKSVGIYKRTESTLFILGGDTECIIDVNTKATTLISTEQMSISQNPKTKNIFLANGANIFEKDADFNTVNTYTCNANLVLWDGSKMVGSFRSSTYNLSNMSVFNTFDSPSVVFISSFTNGINVKGLYIYDGKIVGIDKYAVDISPMQYFYTDYCFINNQTTGHNLIKKLPSTYQQ